MKIYKTVIINHDADTISALKRIIGETHPDVKIVAEANTTDKAKEMLMKHKPEIAILGVELTKGTSFDILEEMKSKQGFDFEIIFVSLYRRYEYATRALDFYSLAILTIPIDPVMLDVAIVKAKEKHAKKSYIEQQLAKLKEINERNNPIIIPTANHNKVAVSVSDITHFKAEGQTTVVYLNDGSTLTAFCILGYFKNILAEKHDFYLVHKSIFVNVAQVKAFRYNHLEITLKNGKKLTASQRYGKDFKKYWEESNVGKNGLWKELSNPT